jgi:ribosome-associated protein
LEQLSILATRKRSSVIRLNRNSKIFKTIIQAIQDKKAQNIISLDLRKIPEAVADFFIICEAGSTTQVRAVADSVEEEVKNNCEELPYKHEGRTSMQWVLIDYVNVVVHVMLPENRRFYKLEDMWSDAPLEKYGD